MRPRIRERLDGLKERHAEITALLGIPEVINDSSRFTDLSREYAELQPVVDVFDRLETADTRREETRAMLDELGSGDAEMRDMAQEELGELETAYQALNAELETLLVPKDPEDERNIFLEVRAGTGGDEAALFAGDLLRMYTRFAELEGWQVELVNGNEGEHGGYKEAIARISGRGVFARMKFESGGHRVQRVPATESQGRIHTSACTVAVLPEMEAVDSIHIDPSDLRIDTYRASGAGGQHVNKTDSAIRITHLPTNTVVECQDERSQHKNRARAMSLLSSRLLAAERERQTSERAETRRLLVGSGDRSQRIRTYNFPQGRVTDHRINLTLYSLDEVMTGALHLLLNPLQAEHNADQLAALGDG